jgi:hypothetical protein
VATVSRAWPRTLALVATLACSGVRPVAQVPLAQETLDAAASRIEAFAASREDVELVEGGLRAPWQTWRWEERDVWEPGPPLNYRAEAPWIRHPMPVRERVLVGPSSAVLPWRRMEAVRVHRWPLGTALEFDVEGEPEPFLLGVDSESAGALAEAFDVVRRAHRPRAGAAGTPPAD